MKRHELLTGTRPEIPGGNRKIIMTGAEGFDGYEIMEYKGMVWGIWLEPKIWGRIVRWAANKLQAMNWNPIPNSEMNPVREPLIKCDQWQQNKEPMEYRC